MFQQFYLRIFFLLHFIFPLFVFANGEPLVHLKYSSQDQNYSLIFKSMESYRQKGINQFILNPEENDILHVANSNNYPAGDLYVLFGLKAVTSDSSDELIRKADYDDIYQTLKRVSDLRFRVIINMYAGINHLQEALENDRPTIIIWTSHGNSTGFYAATGDRIPYNIFSKIKPNVYQLILTACNGAQALRNKYKPKDSLFWWAWDGLVYHPSYLGDLINSDKWSPLINRPEETLVHQNLFCKNEENGYALYRTDQTRIDSRAYETQEACVRRVFSSREGFTCVTKDNLADYTLSIKANRTTYGAPYTGEFSRQECFDRLKSASNKKLCRTQDKRTFLVDENGHPIKNLKFNSIEECLEKIGSISET